MTRILSGRTRGSGSPANGAEALGPLVAGLLFPLLGIRGVLLVDAVTFLISAALLAILPRMTAQETSETFLGDAKAGLRYLGKAPAIRAVALGFCAVVAFNGVDDVALVFLSKDLGGGQTAAGLLLAGVGIGLTVGYALLNKLSPTLRMVTWLIMGLAVSSAGNLLSGLAWAVGAAFVLQTVRGLGIAAMDVGANTLIQRKVPAELLGRVFGNFHGAIGAAAAFSYLAGGLLLDLTSASATLVIAGAGGLAATALTAWKLRQHSSDVFSQ